MRTKWVTVYIQGKDAREFFCQRVLSILSKLKIVPLFLFLQLEKKKKAVFTYLITKKNLPPKSTLSHQGELSVKKFNICQNMSWRLSRAVCKML